MPELSDFRVSSVQAVIFTPDLNANSSKRLVELLSLWSGLFDGEPAILPLPDGAPREIPKAVLNSARKDWRCEIAPARLTFTWSRSGGAEEPSVQRFCDIVVPMTAQYLDLWGAKTARLALILQRFQQHQNPAAFLARHFCRPELQNAPFDRPENFELHAHKSYQLGRFKVNSWVRNKTGALGEGNGAAKPVVVVEQDLNTVDEPSVSYTSDDIREFYSSIQSELDSILGLYFPKDSQS